MTNRNFAERVAIPADKYINSGLSNARQATMKAIFGKPGALSHDCSDITNDELRKKLVTRDVGPFKVTGHKWAVESLTRIFAKVEERDAELYNAVKTAGMLCCRAVRSSKSSYSNHAWGTAIDLYFGGDVEPMGTGMTQAGVLALYPYFHAEGWFWLAEASRDDSMHFELADETVRQLHADGKI